MHSAQVEIEGKVTAEIGPGLLIYLGVGQDDQQADLTWLAGKTARLRLFEDHCAGASTGRPELSLCTLVERGYGALVVSQFTFHASTRKGNRPSFSRAEEPEKARSLYRDFCMTLQELIGSPVQTGCFGADMNVTSTNNGPFTILIDSQNRD